MEFIAIVIIGNIMVALLTLMILPVILTRAWVATKLWGWFVVPLFHLPPLSVAVALGLSLTAGALLPSTTVFPKVDPAKKFTKEDAYKILGSFLGPLLTLLLGYLVHLWM